MAKRSSGGGGLGLIAGALVLIALIPKEVWIALGVMVGFVLAIFVAIKLFGPKQSVTTRSVGTDPLPPQEPTLAEWMASNPLTPPSTDRRSDRAALVENNRERAQALRAKFPPSREHERVQEAATRAASLDGPLQHTPTVPANRQTQSDANRERIQALRERLAAYPPRTTAQGNAPAVGAPPSPAPSSSPAQSISAPTPKPERSLGDFIRMLRGAPEPDRLYSTTGISPTQPPVHALPAAPAGIRETCWLRPGEAVQIAGLTLPGGMLYIGSKLTAKNGRTEPALIDPQLSVASQGDFRERHTNYWPSYADITPTARRAYLRWLAEGRSHPACDIGLVFLFFYGLERRVFIDSQQDKAAKSDWPAILAEIRRLLSIYGETSSSFKRYAGELLSWLELDGGSNKLYLQPVPDFPRTYEVPPYVRLALGQSAVDHKPLPAALALSWLRLSPDIYLRTAATRCPEEFERLFAQRYHELLGDGLVLPKNRTKLKFVYQPASGGLQGVKITMGFENVPDATALTAPIKTLREIAEQCTNELGSYSRLVGKDPSSAGSLEALLLLPASLWPPAARARLQDLAGRMRDGRMSLTLRELLAALGGNTQIASRDVVRTLARALEGEQIGMEPDVLAGARVPSERDTVVLFSLPVSDALVGSRAEFQTGALTLQLAAAMAMADGVFHAKEVEHLHAEIERWSHLTPAERTRLHAHLHWLISTPPTLSSLKKRLEPLSVAAREAIAAFMATLAQADGFVSPDEVKFLEKLYKALGVETKRVFNDIHAASAGAAPSTPKPADNGGFRLDADRIAALQADTARVSSLLSKIFTEEVASPAPAPEPEEPVVEGASGSLLALDVAHSALLRLMLSRPNWSRAELEDAAADLELMLDGALEQINEAAFDAFDAPLCEGDDPVEVNPELMEKLEA